MPSRVNEYAYDHATFGSGVAGALAVLVRPANKDRRGLVICNTSLNDMFLTSGAPGDAGQGIYIPSKGGYEWNATNLTHLAIYAYSDDGSSFSWEERT